MDSTDPRDFLCLMARAKLCMDAYIIHRMDDGETLLPVYFLFYEGEGRGAYVYGWYARTNL